MQIIPLRYVGGVRLALVRIVLGEPSAVVLKATGEAHLAGGDCGLCDGVEGTERDLIGVGEIFAVSVSAIAAVNPLHLDILLWIEDCS